MKEMKKEGMKKEERSEKAGGGETLIHAFTSLFSLYESI